jgi:hypothetical protein
MPKTLRVLIALNIAYALSLAISFAKTPLFWTGALFVLTVALVVGWAWRQVWSHIVARGIAALKMLACVGIAVALGDALHLTGVLVLAVVGGLAAFEFHVLGRPNVETYIYRLDRLQVSLTPARAVAS